MKLFQVSNRVCKVHISSNKSKCNQQSYSDNFSQTHDNLKNFKGFKGFKTFSEKKRDRGTSRSAKTEIRGISMIYTPETKKCKRTSIRSAKRFQAGNIFFLRIGKNNLRQVHSRHGKKLVEIRIS